MGFSRRLQIHFPAGAREPRGTRYVSVLQCNPDVPCRNEVVRKSAVVCPRLRRYLPRFSDVQPSPCPPPFTAHCFGAKEGILKIVQQPFRQSGRKIEAPDLIVRRGISPLDLATSRGLRRNGAVISPSFVTHEGSGRLASVVIGVRCVSER